MSMAALMKRDAKSGTNQLGYSNVKPGGAGEAKPKTPATTVMHKGQKHTATGKTGKHLGTGETMHEYERVDATGARTGHHIWQTASGKIHED